MPVNQEIKGKTLKVYLYLLRRGPCELRDIQRGVGLSSPSLASYHLRRLVQAGAVTQDKHGTYHANKEASDKILEGYSRIGPAIVPQLFFFALLFTILVAFFSYETLYAQSYAPYLVAVSIATILVIWYETVKLWRRLAV